MKEADGTTERACCFGKSLKNHSLYAILIRPFVSHASSFILNAIYAVLGIEINNLFAACYVPLNVD